MKNETIVDRVVERLKLQPIGDLITEEDLHDIVKQAIPKAFFEKRTEIVHSSYRSETLTKDPLIVEIMRDLLKSSTEKAVDTWVREHSEEILSNWKAVMDAGIEKYVSEIQARRTTAHLSEVLRHVVQKMNDERRSRGENEIQVYL